jgi:amino acid transporter
MASDGKWYPPELWTGPPTAAPTPTPSAPNPSPDPGYPGLATPYPGQPTPYPAQAAGYPGQPPGPAGVPYGSPYPQQPYGQYPPYGPVAVKHTNGLAVASLVCACVGWLFFLPAVIAIIFGFVSRSQIRQSAGTQGGDGLAVAGIIVGFAWIALFVVLVAIGVANRNNTNGVVGFLNVLNVVGLGA